MRLINSLTSRVESNSESLCMEKNSIKSDKASHIALNKKNNIFHYITPVNTNLIKRPMLFPEHFILHVSKESLDQSCQFLNSPKFIGVNISGNTE